MAEKENILKVIPSDVEAERALLSACINDKEAIIDVIGSVLKEDFFVEEHKVIFEAIMDLFNENVTIDFVVLNSKIIANGYKGTVIDIPYLADIASNVMVTENVVNYANIIKDKSILRQVIHNNREVLQECYEGEKPTQDILQKVESDVFNLLSSKNKSDYSHIKDVIGASLEKIEELYNNKGKITGVPTGFTELDRMTSGLQANEMVLVAARPAMGKTAFALNIVENAAIKKGVPTAIFSLEMSKEQITNRIISGYAMIEATKMKNGSLNEEDFDKLLKASRKISEAPIFIDDTPGISVAELRAKCRRLKITENIGLVVIDYLQLMEANPGRGGRSRQEEVSEISRNIKAIARELKCPVIALSQLSRNCEARPDKRPMLSDLRESGAIEQDSDIVMFLYRDEYYNEDTERKGEGEIIIAKNRSGQTGTARVGWLGEYTKYTNLEKSFVTNVIKKNDNDDMKNSEMKLEDEVIVIPSSDDEIPIVDMEEGYNE
ncbi:MAG: replicative DNA helicase [Clostridia bacterium]|nr:replicative DNA helicase [Clostridia bacterium]